MITQTQREKIYNALAEVFVDLIRQNKIGPYEQKQFAKKVLAHIDTAETYDSVMKFIDEMVTIYPALQIARAKLRDDVNKVHEQAVMSELQSYFKSAARTKGV